MVKVTKLKRKITMNSDANKGFIFEDAIKLLWCNYWFGLVLLINIGY